MLANGWPQRRAGFIVPSVESAARAAVGPHLHAALGPAGVVGLGRAPALEAGHEGVVAAGDLLMFCFSFKKIYKILINECNFVTLATITNEC